MKISKEKVLAKAEHITDMYASLYYIRFLHLKPNGAVDDGKTKEYQSPKLEILLNELQYHVDKGNILKEDAIQVCE